MSHSFLFQEKFPNSISLQIRRVRAKIPNLREAVALLDLDRDERKLDAFLQLHKADLQVLDLRIFLPFTINLDPYLRKVLKEDQQALEDDGIIMPIQPQRNNMGKLPSITVPQQSQRPTSANPFNNQPAKVQFSTYTSTIADYDYKSNEQQRFYPNSSIDLVIQWIVVMQYIKN